MEPAVDFPTLDLPVRPPYAPMEALSVDTLPPGEEWSFEPKWDGFRCLAFREGERVVLQSKSAQTLTRYGGDEFAVLLVNTPKVGALRYAERILGIVARHRFVHGHLTVSMGVATLPDDVRAADELIPASDRALYAAKQAGRNNIQSAAC